MSDNGPGTNHGCRVVVMDDGEESKAEEKADLGAFIKEKIRVDREA